ncbi:uncharacterized protein LOC132307434 [Cornus florida]|uniref:uncharacterized protein LOC132307434 n=1 Tax=Cornus florida TaxID=4283 RepID=UPI00289BC388|nr:uncharacterized protein LOC132307434 [Cornus florida]
MEDAILLSLIFRSSVHLQDIDIINRARSNSRNVQLPYDESMFWEKTELFDSIKHHLRVVWIRGFAGREREMRLASHLIQNATMLEKIVIQLFGTRSTDHEDLAISAKGLLKCCCNPETAFHVYNRGW